MIIEKIHIDNFGKLSNVDMTFSDGLNQIIGENGWGKTTLSTFIKVMFFGMPASRDKLKAERKKYFPWQGGIFGGFIEFATKEGRFRLTRSFGKTPEGDSIEILNLSKNLKIDNQVNEIGEELFGVGNETFEMTAFFPQLDFKSGSNNQISSNLLGLDKFNYDLANLNEAIEKIKKKLTDVKREKPKKELVNASQKKLIEYNREILDIENKLIENKKQLNNIENELNEFESQYNVIKQQTELQENLYKTKSNLNCDLYRKNEQLNNLLLQLEELKMEGKEFQVKTKNKWLLPCILSILAIILIADIVLFSINILKMTPMIIIAVVVVLATFLSLSLKKPKVISENNNSEENEIKKNVEEIKSSISIIKATLEGYVDIQMPDDKYCEDLKEKIYNKKIEKEKVINENYTLQRDYDSLLEKCDYLHEDILRKEELIKKSDEDINTLIMTKDFLLKANENVSSRFVEPVNRAIKELTQMVDLRGRKYVIDTNFAIKEETNTGIKELDYSSQGYQDILSFCMRKYLISEIFKKEKPFIVLDDTFVNLDDENLNKIKQIVLDFSKENQIIYVCCNSRCKLD